MKPLAFLLMASLAPHAPLVGIARSSSGQWMRVSGLPGTLTVEPATDLDGADAVFSTSRLLVIRRSESVEFFEDGFSCCSVSFSSRAQLAAGDSSPLLVGFSKSASEAILATSTTLHHYTNHQLTEIPFLHGGQLLALTLPTPNQATVLVQNEPTASLLTIHLPDGATQNEANLAPGISAAVLFPSGSALLLRDSQIIHRAPSGEENPVELPAAITALNWLGPDWAQATTATGTNFAIRIEPKLRVMELPEVQP